jgi:hypothetical protein
MAAKTKSKKKQTKSKSKSKSKKTTARKMMSVKKKAVKTKARAHKKISAKRTAKPKNKAREKKRTPEPAAFSLKKPGTRSGRQSGDLQGLSRMEGADSESVAELIEEGNPFEADVVLGVESADADESEVRTHEVPEDDVPDEYLDKD